VNVSSLSAILAIPELAPYSAAKGGVDAFTRAAAIDFGPDIRVNAVRPGFIRTPQTANAYADGTDRHARIAECAIAGRLGDPEEVVGAAIYLASDAADYTTGEILTVDGGFVVGAFG
jgi:NAD(P)-dependent dehydrogenase (short-subunit alcohol dehydrogenase family)